MRKVFTCVGIKEVELGQKVVVARCCSGHSYLGEFGTITKFLKKHIVITTESGAIVKVDECFNTVGKAKKENYWASIVIDNRQDMIQENVKYWNDKKVCFENK